MWQESEDSSDDGGPPANNEEPAASETKSKNPPACPEPEENDDVADSKSSSSDDDNEDDSDYEKTKSDDDANEEEDEEDSGTARSASSASSSSDSSDSAPKKRSSKRPSGKIDDGTRKALVQDNFVRRSCRSQQKVLKDATTSEESEKASEDEWSDDDQPKRSRRAKKATPPKRSSASRKKAKPAASAKRGSRPSAKKKSVDYTEKDSDEDIDDDDVLEWEEEKESPPGSVAAANGAPGVETIERVIKCRMGVPGQTGARTTRYNMANDSFDSQPPPTGEATELQFLIKWVGWSHIHNTWESEASIALMGAGGLKKLQNFVKKMQDDDLVKKNADKEYIEYMECEREMAEELCEEYTKAERLVAHQVSRDRAADGSETTEYLVKWCCLPYSECTWEESRLLPQEKIDEYHERIENLKSPVKSAQVLRRRPKFSKLEEQPKFLRCGGTLRDYQLQSLNWMIHAWCKYNSCILADEMGLGKTIQSISFLATLYHRYELYGPFLVVVPLSTLAAWQKEFAQWAPSLNMVTYLGDVASREQIRQYEWYLASTKKLKINAVLTTYEILLKDKAFLGGVDWAALLVDEAHRLKNDESLLYKCLIQFNCNHRLLITGTPLQNSLKELWALLHFIMPEKFDSWEEFEADHNDQDHKGISALHRKLEPFLLRRVKKDVEKSLPPKLEQILRVDMTAQQKQFYKWILTKNYKELSKGVKGSINGFVNLVMELKKCCNHASLVRANDYYETDTQARLQQMLKSSGKLILLDKLLCRLRDTGHRVLIFSQMVMMLDILQEYLQLRRFPAQRLDGSMRADLRKQALDHFNAEGSTDFAFLLSTRAGGLGINLATADTVIIFDSDWNPQNDLQAMSRAHRIGQTRQVNIYRLVTKTSVEEDIVERAKRKLVLDHLVIQRMDTTGRTVLSKGAVPFDKHELNDILKFGAAELFKEKEGEEQEPEVDIDRILSGAETREAEDIQDNGNELLNAFKYANFTIDEEKDLAAAAVHANNGADGAGTDGWDNIIPEEQRLRIEEEEKMKEAAALMLGPRQRVKVNEKRAKNDDEESAGGEGSGAPSDSDDDEAGGGGRKKRRKAFGDFSGAEVKRFVRSFRKFAHPLERLEAIAADAELEEHSADELKKLCEALLEGCAKAEEEENIKKEEPPPTPAAEEDSKDAATEKGSGRPRGLTFKFAGVVDVNVKQIRKQHTELNALHAAVASTSKASVDEFKMTANTRPQKGWDVDWLCVDDIALLKGVYKHGLGSWDAIKMDPDLGLAEKLHLKDKTKKPQPPHLQQRVTYLLKVLTKTEEIRTMKEGGAKRAGAKTKRKVDEKTITPPEKKRKETGAAKKKEKDHRKSGKDDEKTSSGGPAGMAKSFADTLSLISIDKSLYGEALNDPKDKPFTDCVKMMRPVQKYIKRLSDSTDPDSKETLRYIVKLGDNCRDQLHELLQKKPKTNVRKWYNYMWIFLSRFVSKEPMEMLDKYRNFTNSTHRHHKHHKDKEHKEKDHKVKDQKEKGKEDQRDKEKSRKEHGATVKEEREQQREKDRRESGGNNKEERRDHHRNSGDGGDRHRERDEAKRESFRKDVKKEVKEERDNSSSNAPPAAGKTMSTPENQRWGDSAPVSAASSNNSERKRHHDGLLPEPPHHRDSPGGQRYSGGYGQRSYHDNSSHGGSGGYGGYGNNQQQSTPRKDYDRDRPRYEKDFRSRDRYNSSGNNRTGGGGPVPDFSRPPPSLIGRQPSPPGVGSGGQSFSSSSYRSPLKSSHPTDPRLAASAASSTPSDPRLKSSAAFGTGGGGRAPYQQQQQQPPPARPWANNSGPSYGSGGTGGSRY